MTEDTSVANLEKVDHIVVLMLENVLRPHAGVSLA